MASELSRLIEDELKNKGYYVEDEKDEEEDVEAPHAVDEHRALIGALRVEARVKEQNAQKHLLGLKRAVCIGGGIAIVITVWIVMVVKSRGAGNPVPPFFSPPVGPDGTSEPQGTHTSPAMSQPDQTIPSDTSPENSTWPPPPPLPASPLLNPQQNQTAATPQNQTETPAALQPPPPPLQSPPPPAVNNTAATVEPPPPPPPLPPLTPDGPPVEGDQIDEEDGDIPVDEGLSPPPPAYLNPTKEGTDEGIDKEVYDDYTNLNPDSDLPPG